MPTLPTHVDRRSETFAARREAMLERIAEVRALEGRVAANSGSKAASFAKKGRLLPRERVVRLLDRGAPFLELSTLAGLRMHDDDGGEAAAGGGSIIGVGFVEGVRCLVTANDSAIKGGAISPMGLKKSLRAQEIARREKLPCINLVESAGANLLYQAELFVDGGRVFANMARLSAQGVPQITVVHGSSTAGGAYLPGLSDAVVVVRDQARIFLAGPPLVKAAIGEDATDEELGGAVLHATVTGTAEYLAEDDAHGIAYARALLAALDWDRPAAPRSFEPPKHDVDDLLGLVPDNHREAYDVREVIGRIVDGSDFLEWKAGYGPATVCGHARIEGHAVGVLGNNGPLDPDGSAKAGHFIQFCEQAGTPLVYLHNITGYMVGLDAERGGIVKHGSKMIQAVANATVPAISILIGGSFGAGNYGMCGRGFDPRFIFSWPNARISVMGGEQAAGVMEIIFRQKMARFGVEPDPEALSAMREKIVGQLEAESTALYATARLWDDGIIDPRDTRTVLAQCLATCRESEARQLRPNSFGVARF
jgi:geranyl-CoA carboxylase beta subunit